MGYAMAGNIRQKASPETTLYVNDVHRPFCDKFVEEFGRHGPIKIVNSAREVAELSQVVISIVPAAEHVRAVYLDESSGVIAASKSSGRLMLECSTIDAQTTREIGEALKTAGAGQYIDTPVSVSLTPFFNLASNNT